MRTVVQTSIREFAARELSEPEIENDDEVLIQIQTVGVCGSDLHYYRTGRIGDQVIEYPFIIGHETAGVVIGTGSGVTRVSPGQRIAVDPAAFCGDCDQCRAGRQHTCHHLKFLGCPGQLDGALRERLVLPEICCYPIPDALTYDQAALSEPLAIAMYAVARARIPKDTHAGILGAGPIGISVAHALRSHGCDGLYMTDKLEYRIQFAANSHLNPVWAGNPDRDDVAREIATRVPELLDVVFECSGDPDAIRQSAGLLKPGGKIIIIGIPEVDEVSLPIHELRRREIDVFSIRRQANFTQKALDALTSKSVQMDDLVTHRFPLQDTSEAFALVDSYSDGVMKVMIDVWAG